MYLLNERPCFAPFGAANQGRVCQARSSCGQARCDFSSTLSCTSSPRVSKNQKRPGRSMSSSPRGDANFNSEIASIGQTCARFGTCLAAAATLFVHAPFHALAFGPVSVKLSDIQVNTVPCKKGTITVTGGENFDATCLRVSATALNPSSKAVYNADVFGRVYDATGEPALDATENIRIAYIAEIPPGSSTISFGLTIAQEQAKYGPVKIKGLKASGFEGKNLPGQGSGVVGDIDCDPVLVELGECDPDAALIR